MNAKPMENPPESEPTPGETPEAEAAAAPSAEEAAAHKIAELEAQVATYRDQTLRALADAENTRKRASRDIEDTARYAVSNFASDIVGVVENLKRASASITEEQRSQNELLKNLGSGVDMVMQELLSVLERHGIVRIDPQGEKFNHNYHQAVAQVEDPKAEPGTVAQVLQAGYVIHDRLLRPAMVSVVKAPAKPES